MDIHFEGRSVLVTGAARGIGRGIVEAFAHCGANVIATDVLTTELAVLSEGIQAKRSGSIETRSLDVTDPAQASALLKEVELRTHAIDVLVHVAGGVLGQAGKPIESVTDNEWQVIGDVNLRGAFNMIRAAVPGMKKHGRGRIVVISSAAGLGISFTGIQAYAASKAAQLGLVRQLGHELGPFGITVNAIAPGFLRTSPDYERQWASYGPAGQEALIEQIPMRRLGEPEDIAGAALFLASDFASWITGQVLPVTGGPIC